MRRALNIVRGLGAAAFGLVAYFYLTLPDVRPLTTVNPTTTAFMELRAHEADATGRPIRRDHRWVRYSRISQHLKRAVLVAEDSAFWDHEGIDLEEIRKSMEVNLREGRAVRGASTITQQLAKNLYLSPSRDPFRKLRELIIARRLEAALSKARIFEIYLNVVEWGDGVWGAEAAARRYFGIPASEVGPAQAALLAGALVNPRLLSPARPTGRLVRRQRLILARMGGVTPPSPTPVFSPEPTPLPTEPAVEELPPSEATLPDIVEPSQHEESVPPPPDEPGPEQY